MNGGHHNPLGSFVFHGRGGAFGYRPCLLFFMEGCTVKITTFNNQPVRHVRYMPDGTVMLTLSERRPSGRPRHLRVSMAKWLAGRGVYLLDSHAARRAQARQLARRGCG